MAYLQPKTASDQWNPRLLGGVTVQAFGSQYVVRVAGAANGVVTSNGRRSPWRNANEHQNWVRAGKLKHLKIPRQPSAIPFAEIKR